MNPKITDEGVSRLDLHEGRTQLLEEIMAVTKNAERVSAMQPRSRRRWTPAVVAAAAVLAIATAPLWLGDDSPSTAPDSPGVAAPGKGEIAVLPLPGWKLAYSSIDREDGGELSYQAKDESIDATPNNDWGVTLDIHWRPADQYATYLNDRKHISKEPTPGVPIEVLGVPARMWAYSADDHTVIREVVGDFSLEVRGSGMDEAAFRRLLTQLKAIAPSELDRYLPEEFVTDAERADAIAGILQPIPVPDGFDPSSIETVETDRYQLGADVTRAVTCAWIDVHDEARKAGDVAAAERAAEAMATSRDWPILDEMMESGEWSPGIWQIADEMQDGAVDKEFLGDLCEGLGTPAE